MKDAETARPSDRIAGDPPDTPVLPTGSPENGDCLINTAFLQTESISGGETATNDSGWCPTRAPQNLWFQTIACHWPGAVGARGRRLDSPRCHTCSVAVTRLAPVFPQPCSRLSFWKPIRFRWGSSGSRGSSGSIRVVGGSRPARPPNCFQKIQVWSLKNQMHPNPWRSKSGNSCCRSGRHWSVVSRCPHIPQTISGCDRPSRQQLV